jgi:recombination protein RecT
MANGDDLRNRAAASAAERRAATDDTPKPSAEVATRADAAPTGDTQAYKLIAGWAEELGQALAPGQDLQHFMRMSAILLSSSKSARRIAECDRPTIYNALAQCAHYGLLPDGRHAAIVPYSKVATFVPMKDGLIQLAFNTGQIRAIVCQLIYERDEWAEELGPQGRGFIHRPARFTKQDGRMIPVERAKIDASFQVIPGRGEDNPPLLAYCYAVWADGHSTDVEFMTAQEAIDIRDRYSKAYEWAEQSHYGKPAKRDSFWHTDPDLAWQKSVLRRAMHRIPKSAALVELLLADDAADSKLPGQVQPYSPPPMPAGGPAVAWEGDVTHDPDAVVTGEVVTEPGEVRDRNTSLAELWAIWSEAGWGDEDSSEAAAVRYATAAALLNPDAGVVPYVITSLSELTDEQLDRVAKALRMFAQEHPGNLHDEMGDLAMEVIATQTQQAEPAHRPRTRAAS